MGGTLHKDLESCAMCMTNVRRNYGPRAGTTDVCITSLLSVVRGKFSNVIIRVKSNCENNFGRTSTVRDGLKIGGEVVVVVWKLASFVKGGVLGRF